MITDYQHEYMMKFAWKLVTMFLISITVAFLILSAAGVSIVYLYGQNLGFDSKVFTNDMAIKATCKTNEHSLDMERNGCFELRKFNDKEKKKW